MGTNCALLLADFFLSYEAEFMQKRCNDKKKITKAKAINFTFRCIDDVLSINIPNFDNWIPLIYHKELEKRKEQKQLPLPHFLTFTSNLTPRVNFLPDFMTKETSICLLGIIINFPHICRNIPIAPAYRDYIPQLKLYARVCCLYSGFLRPYILSTKLLNQGFLRKRLIFQKVFQRISTTC